MNGSQKVAILAVAVLCVTIIAYYSKQETRERPDVTPVTPVQPEVVASPVSMTPTATPRSLPVRPATDRGPGIPARAAPALAPAGTPVEVVAQPIALQVAAPTARQTEREPERQPERETLGPAPSVTTFTLGQSPTPEPEDDAPGTPSPGATSPGAASPGATSPGATEVASPGPAPRTYTYTVKFGDTLSGIAARELGSANDWDLITAVNPSLNADRLQPGMELLIPVLPPQPEQAATPAAAAEPAPDPGSGVVHITEPGQSLSAISHQYYGRAGYWRRIYEANRQVIGDNPDRLKTGLRLTIPSME